MSNQNFVPKHQEEFLRSIMKLFDVWASIFVLLFIFLFLYAFNFLPEWKTATADIPIANSIPKEDPNRIEAGIHVASGLIVDEHYELVVNNCGGCHSHKLVTQNHADAAGWTATIRWMQKTQKLWDLGENEAKIVAYLAKNYGLKKKSRRENLKVEEWYFLE